MKKELIPLALGGLSIGMTEFVMMGILPNVAAYFDISIAAAGHFISLYALGVVIGAPFIVFLSGKIAPKKILLGLMILFTLFNGLSLFSVNEEMMNLTRFLSGLPHGAFFGVGSIVAKRLAKEGEEAKNISMMFTGLTVANLVMVPLGTYLGQHVSWQLTMAVVAFVGLITSISLYTLLPDLPIKRSTDIKGELSFFKTKEAWLIVSMIAIGTGGLFAWLSYIAPLMTNVAGLDESWMMLVMVLVGLGMVIGNIVGGRLADKVSPIKATITLFALLAITLISLFFFSDIVWLALLLSFLCGAFGLSLAAPIQLLMLRTAGDAEMVASGSTQSAFNIGNSIGAFLGGAILSAGFGFQFPPLVGAGLALLGVLIAFIFHKVTANNLKRKITA